LGTGVIGELISGTDGNNWVKTDAEGIFEIDEVIFGIGLVISAGKTGGAGVVPPGEGTGVGAPGIGTNVGGGGGTGATGGVIGAGSIGVTGGTGVGVMSIDSSGSSGSSLFRFKNS